MYRDRSHAGLIGRNFLYLADGEALLEDLGSGEYTKKYFSDERYEIFCTRGKGHNMPIIGGVDQKAGSNYCADAFERKPANKKSSVF